MKTSLLAIVLFALTVTDSYSQLFVPGSGVTDIDGNFYPSVVMNNGQEWTTENLRTSHFANGDPIPINENDGQWASNAGVAACWYFNDSAAYSNPYGKLYNWKVAEDVRNACPDGWHVPTLQDHIDLITFLGGEGVAADKLKEAGTAHWNTGNTGTNESGFTGLPGGNRRASDGWFFNIGDYGQYWSSTVYDGSSAYKIILTLMGGSMQQNAISSKRSGHSIRCLNDIVTSTNDIDNQKEDLIIFPNPGNGIFNIVGNGNLAVYNSLGQEVSSLQLANRSVVNLSNQPDGIYIIKLITNEQTNTKILVKE